VLTWLNLALLFVILTMVVWAGKLYRRVKELTRQDALTGALSRRGFIGVLGDESKRARRYLHPLTVVYVDLDDFKVVNDVLGHETGNSVLQVVARTMQSTLREVDFVARLGGDEFALLLSETMAGDIRGVLNKLQTALLEAMKAKDWRVTFSIGAVMFNDPLATPEEMMRCHCPQSRPAKGVLRAPSAVQSLRRIRNQHNPEVSNRQYKINIAT